MTLDLSLCEPATPEELPGDWLAERKLDGIRAYSKDGRLFKRSGTEITHKFPEIDPPTATVDGELVAVSGSFEAINGRHQLTNRFDIEMRAEADPARLIAFDVLAAGGDDLRDRPLRDRSARLHDVTKEHDGVGVVEPHNDPLDLWQTANDQGWEGIVVKDPTAPYPGERSESWLKVKTWREDTFPIVGFERTNNDGFVALVDVGAGEPQKVVANGQADQQAIASGADRAEVQFLERSTNDRLRKPSLKRVA